MISSFESIKYWRIFTEILTLQEEVSPALNDLNMSTALSTTNDTDAELSPPVTDSNESIVSGSKDTNNIPKDFTPPSTTYSSHPSHRSHTVRPLSNALKETKEIFAEAVQALKVKRPCSTNEEDPFLVYIKRRMMKFNDSDRQELEDTIIDTIRKFEKNVPSQTHSLSMCTAPQMPNICTSSKGNVVVPNDPTEKVKSCSKVFSDAPQLPNICTSSNGNAVVPNDSTKKVKSSSKVFSNEMNYSSLMERNRPSSAIIMNPKVPLTMLASTTVSSLNRDMSLEAPKKTACKSSKNDNDVLITEDCVYNISVCDLSSLMTEEEEMDL